MIGPRFTFGPPQRLGTIEDRCYIFPAILAGIGALAGKIAGGRASGRAAEGELGLKADQIALDRARLGKDFEGTDARRMLSSDILSHLTSGAKLGRPSTFPTMEGAGPGVLSNLSPEARAAFLAQAGALRGAMPGAAIPPPTMRNDGTFAGSLADRNARLTYARGPKSVGVVGVPGATSMPKPGLGDSILGILSGVGQFGGLIPGKKSNSGFTMNPDGGG